MPPLNPRPFEGGGASLFDDAALRLGGEAWGGAAFARLAPPMLAAMLEARVFFGLASCVGSGLDGFDSSRVGADELPVVEPDAVVELELDAVVELGVAAEVGGVVGKLDAEPVEVDGVPALAEP